MPWSSKCLERNKTVQGGTVKGIGLIYFWKRDQGQTSWRGDNRAEITNEMVGEDRGETLRQRHLQPQKPKARKNSLY